MCNRGPMMLTLAALLSSAGCATNEDPVDVASRAAFTAATGIAYQVAVGNCEKLNPITARDACLERMRESEDASRQAKPAPKDRFEDLEEYRVKRE